jgi:hypothetical protein
MAESTVAASEGTGFFQRVWRFVKLVGLTPRFSALCVFPVASVLLGVAFLFSGQGSELLRAFRADDLRSGVESTYGWLQLSALVVAWCLWSLATWYSARRLVDYRFPNDDTPNPGIEPTLKRMRFTFPRFLGILCAISLPLANEYAGHVQYVTAHSFSGWSSASGVVVVLYQTFLLQVVAYALLQAIIPAKQNPPIRLLTWIAWIGVGVGVSSKVFAWEPLPLGYAGGALLAGLGVVTAASLYSIYDTTGLRRTLQILALGLLLVGLWTYGHEDNLLVPLLLIIVSALLSAFMVWRRHVFKKPFLDGVTAASIRQAGIQIDKLPRAAHWIFACSCIAIALLVVGFHQFPVGIGQFLGAPAVVLIAITAWTVVGAVLLVLAPKSLGGPSLVLLPVALLVLFGSCNDNHALRDVAPRVTDQRKDVESQLKTWRERNQLTDSEPIFVVAAAGGGLRAAWWTARAMAVADDETCGAFSRRVFAMSSVSGGSLGAAAYVAMMADSRASRDSASDCWPHMITPRSGAGDATDAVTEMVSGDFLSPAVGAMLFPDLIQRLLPAVLLPHDRAYALESSWERRWSRVFATDRFAKPFLSLYEGSGVGLPALVINATAAEDGRRAVASSLRFLPRDGFDLFRDSLVVDNLRLSSAVHNSARFPYVSPSATVWREVTPKDSASKREIWGRLVDGGYFENSGAESAIEIVEALALAQGGNRKNLYAVIISNDPAARSTCGGGRSPDGAVRKRGARALPRTSEILTPLDAIFAAREARGTLAERRLVDAVGGCPHVLEWSYGDRLLYSKGAQMLDSIVVNPSEPALGWYLSKDSRASLGDASAELPKRMPFCVRLIDKAGKQVGVLKPRFSCDSSIQMRAPAWQPTRIAPNAQP